MKSLFKIASVAVVLGMFWSLSGCATILASKQKDVSFAAEPDGAQVYVNGNLIGTTPVKMELQNNKEYTIEFKKEGYQSKSYYLTKGIGVGWIILDVVFGLVPVVVDAVTGDWNFLTSDNVRVVLEK